MTDTRWLQRRGPGYYAVQDVPRSLQKVLGRRRFVKSLQTRDLRVAVARRHSALAEFALQVAEAQRQSGVDPVVDAGLAWRDTFASVARGDPSVIGPMGADQTDAHDTAETVFQGEIGRLQSSHGVTAAKAFHDLARGLATPLLTYADQWLAEGGASGPLKERTRRQYRSDLEEFAAWLQTAGVPTTIEAITKRIAGRYATEALLGGGMVRKTANRKITAVSSYWRWLVKRGHVDGNPWSGQSLSKGSRGSEGSPKRPFTDAEAAILLAGNADPELADLMRVAALSGMRIEEIYRLRVADCSGGWFTISQAKTRAGIRRVPIHSALTDIVNRRTASGSPSGPVQDATAYLFPEAGPPRPGRERSMAVSKRFGHYRKRLGIDDHTGGQRQSSVDFHSWRRFFVTRARNAGIDRAVVAAIVGHETGSITDDLYSGGPSDQQRRACVEAVKLPIQPAPPIVPIERRP